MFITELLSKLFSQYGVRASAAQARKAEVLGYLMPVPARLRYGNQGIRLYLPQHVEQLKVYRQTVKPGWRICDTAI